MRRRWIVEVSRYSNGHVRLHCLVGGSISRGTGEHLACIVRHGRTAYMGGYHFKCRLATVKRLAEFMVDSANWHLGDAELFDAFRARGYSFAVADVPLDL